MTTRAKPSAPPTRASSRTKTPPVPSPSPPPAIKAIKAKASTRSTTTTAGSSTAKTAAARKPLVNRTNPPDAKQAAPKAPAVTKPRIATVAAVEHEPITAYLRIRPHLGNDEPTSLPYLDPLSETAVRMTDPSSDGRGNTAMYHRASTASPSSIYKFSHVFHPSTQQADFFANTTLPLVKDLLDGQNGLLFAYGVTNSGKTYTIQGGSQPGSGGILPRTLDVIFNSVEGLQSDGRYRPVRLYGVEESDSSDSMPPSMELDVQTEPALAEVLAEHMSSPDDSALGADQRVVKLDRNYEYSIWISYVEVYNEKVYDLLASVNDDQDKDPAGFSRSASNPTGQGSNAVFVMRKALSVKPSPAFDSMDDSGIGNGRYISGLKQFRITTAAQAKALVRRGQLHRRVFGTLANSQSSRSHSMITIKVLRNHRGDRDDPGSVQISRLTIVDLAGSERTKHTHTTGDRLKEAGSINKSLMVLGQCMEVMRSNQRRVAQSLGDPGRSDTRDIKRALAVVPFRHSRLTEILMDYFVGDGRVVMIVNVNPYDTGFDENSHVMKFSALAREVSTVVNNALMPRVPASPIKPSTRTLTGLPRAITRKVTISSFGPGKKLSEAHLEVLEEDEEVNDDQDEDEDDEPINPLVDALFDEIEDLRLRLYEAEMRCAIVEAETREEVMREMEERMRAVERTYAQRLMSEVERNERKMDAKIDMLHQAGLLGTAKKPAAEPSSDSEIEEHTIALDLESDEDSAEEHATDSAMPSSPLEGKGKAFANAKSMEHVISHAELDALPAKMVEDHTDDVVSEHTDEDDEEEDDDHDEIEGEVEDAATNDDASDDYIPPSAAKKDKEHKKASPANALNTTGTRKSTRSVSKLERELKSLSVSEDVPEADESIVIVPNRKLRQAKVEAGPPGIQYVPGKGEVDTVKKKKRQLGKKTIVTEEQVDEVVGDMEMRTRGESKRSVRRMARAS